MAFVFPETTKNRNHLVVCNPDLGCTVHVACKAFRSGWAGSSFRFQAGLPQLHLALPTHCIFVLQWAAPHKHTHLLTYSHTQMHIHTRTTIYTHAYVSTNIQPHIQTHIHTHAQTCTHTHTYIHTSIHAHTHMITYLHTYTHAKMDTYTHVHTYMHSTTKYIA